MAVPSATGGAVPAEAENSSDRAANFDKLTPTRETTGRYHAGRPFFHSCDLGRAPSSEGKIIDGRCADLFLYIPLEAG
jgi:hypothetical protein